MSTLKLNGKSVGGVASDASAVNYGDTTVEEKLNKMTNDIDSLNSTMENKTKWVLIKTINGIGYHNFDTTQYEEFIVEFNYSNTCATVSIPQMLLGSTYKTYKTGGYSASSDTCQFGIQAKSDSFNFVNHAAYVNGSNVASSTNVTIFGKKK